MSSVLISQRRESIDSEDDWVQLRPEIEATATQSPIHDALSALASGYSAGTLSSIELPRSERLRPIEQIDIDAAEYLDSLYDD